jgi:cellulose synthase/poly-beta-1,6-N-acetylglucosamine synthase-like glycosyltransferase
LLTLNSNDDNDNEKLFHNKTNSTKNKTVFLFQRKYSETSPSIQQQHYPPNRLIKRNNNVNSINIPFNNESLFSSSKEENAFLKKCKDNLSPQLFDKILTVINNYNNGEVSYNETVFQIKQLFQSNQDLIISCNKLFK